MRVLIIGLGSVAKKHINALQLIDQDINILALRSSRKALKYQDVINIYSIDEIEPNSIDFVIISNPTSEHKKTLFQIINLDIPVFIEKPLFSSLDIRDLVEIINREKIITYVACNLRFLDSLIFIKNHLSKSKVHKLNEVNVYCGSYLPEWRQGVDFRKTYSAISEYGGGVHLDLIHELDYLFWFFGNPNNVTRSFRSQSSLAISSFDYANFLLDFDGFCANVVLNYYRRDTKRSLELIFDDETWYVDLIKNQILCNELSIFKSEQNISDTYVLQMKYFIDRIINNENTFNNVNDAYEVLKICLGNEIKR